MLNEYVVTEAERSAPIFRHDVPVDVVLLFLLGGLGYRDAPNHKTHRPTDVPTVDHHEGAALAWVDAADNHIFGSLTVFASSANLRNSAAAFSSASGLKSSA